MPTAGHRSDTYVRVFRHGSLSVLLGSHSGELWCRHLACRLEACTTILPLALYTIQGEVVMELSELRKHLKGVFTVQMTPFDEDGRLDLEGMRANTRWLLERAA